MTGQQTGLLARKENHAAAVRLRNSREKTCRLKGAAANIFQKKAMGKFFSTVPAHMAKSCDQDSPPRRMLKRTEVK